VSGIGSLARRHWIELLWGLFALANLVVVVFLADWETIPFHFVWVSLTILYGYRVWSSQTTGLLLVAVVGFTGAALFFAVTRSNEGFDEMAEVPLMAAMFLAMVWHARRRQAAVDEAQRMAAYEQRLRERQRDFVRDASHELRTPITIARGHAELLRAGATDPQTISDADVVIDELGRLARLSERLLVLAAADHAGFLQVGPVDVRALVEETGSRWSAAGDRAWRVEPVVGGTVPGDAGRLRDAADALIENALNATGPGGSIAISGTRRDASFVLAIADDGVGIDPDRLPSLFDRFTRVDTPRTRGGGGTGLGLSIVQAIAQAHGGTVEVESAPGRGATFRIVLPGYRPAPIASVEPVPEPVGRRLALSSRARRAGAGGRSARSPSRHSSTG
jgi:signal transduction histidine kinase